MFPQGAGQDPSLLINCKCDLVLALWAYSSHRQHPPPQPDQSERSTSSPHSRRTLVLTFQTPCLAQGGGQWYCNILVISPGEICSIYRLGRLGLMRCCSETCKPPVAIFLAVCTFKLKTFKEMLLCNSISADPQ
jgi:hypothetical protein